jgi:NAD kinase
MKLRATVGGKTLEALNDIVVHNADPRHAIRYGVIADGRNIHDEVIGDGIVCATPLGSTGYYRSITDSVFEAGIGLAFNNSTEQTDHMVLADTSTITIAITRGPALCYADNQEESLPLAAGDCVTIQKSDTTATMVVVSE